MKLTWHIIRKDIRHARWLLVAWILFVLAPIPVGLWALSGGLEVFMFTEPFAQDNQAGLFLIQSLLAASIIATVIHADRVVGADEHWLALPISGSRLLGAKVGGLLLMLWLLPVLLMLPWWLVARLELHAIGAAAFQQFIIITWLLVPALLVAALTDGWTRFVTWSAVLLFAFALGHVVLATTQSLPPTERPPTTLLLSRASVALLIMALLCAGVVLHQYLRRRLAASLTGVGIGFVAIAGVLVLWPWDLLARESAVPAATPTAETLPNVPVTLQVTQASAEIIRAYGSRQENRLYISADVHASPIGNYDDWAGRVEDARLVWPDGSIYEVISGTRMLLPTPESHVIRRLELLPYGPGQPIERFQREPPKLEITVSGSLFHREHLAEFGIGDGTEVSFGSRHLWITGSHRAGLTLHQLVLVETRPNVLLPRINGARLRGPVPSWRGMEYLRASEGIVDPQEPAARVAGQTRSYGIFAGVEVFRHSQQIEPPRRFFFGRSPEERYGPMDEHWLDEFKLVWTTTTTVAEFRSSFEVERLEMRDQRNRR